MKKILNRKRKNSMCEKVTNNELLNTERFPNENKTFPLCAGQTRKSDINMPVSKQQRPSHIYLLMENLDILFAKIDFFLKLSLSLV